MSTDDLKAVIASTFDLSEDEVTDESSGSTISQWDSIGHLNLIMALEEHFKMSFTVDEIMAMRDVKAIRTTLTDKLRSA